MTDGRPSSAQRAGDSERKEELGKRRERPIWTMRNQLQLKREGGRTKERVKSERTGGKTSSAMHEVDGQEAAAPLKKKMKKDTKQTCQLPPGHRFLRRQVASLCHAEGLRGRLILSLSLLLLQLLHLLLPILLLEMTFEGQASQLNRTWTNLPHRNATSPNLTFHLTWLGLTQNPEAILNAYDLIHPVLSCPVLSCPVLSCPVHSCPVLPCPVLSFQFMFTQSNVVHSTIWKKKHPLFIRSCDFIWWRRAFAGSFLSLAVQWYRNRALTCPVVSVMCWKANYLRMKAPTFSHTRGQVLSPTFREMNGLSSIRKSDLRPNWIVTRWCCLSVISSF